jgi:class 3 adenylate cyclase
VVTPTTHYAKSQNGKVAYQVVGSGPVDLIWATDPTLTVDFMWDHPVVAAFLNHLAAFARLICFDPTGLGSSEQLNIATLPTPEKWLDDGRAVLDAVGSKCAAIVGYLTSAHGALLVAATYPDRIGGVVIIDGTARIARAPDYPCGIPSGAAEKLALEFESLWGTDAHARLFAPSLSDDAYFLSWMARSERLSISPSVAAKMVRTYTLDKLDVRAALPLIRAPTLILHRKDNPYIRVCHGRYLAEHIRGARYVELPGADIAFFAGDTHQIIAEIREFLTGARIGPEEDNRVLATVLMIDIVDSTQKASQLGDRKWEQLLSRYYAVARNEVARFRGREVDTAGDGYFATFEGPSRAVRCASAIRDAVRDLGLVVRAGVHTGECQRMDGDKVGGIAVHLGARVAAAASPDEVLVSSTVKDLVCGSGLQFGDRGFHALKGIAGEWHLFALEQ